VNDHQVYVILDSDVLKARRLARDLAHELAFDEAPAAEIEVTAAELASNLLKHRTVRGVITLLPLHQSGRTGVEIIAEDEGPGIADLDSAMRESTAGTLGIGLSGVRRMNDEFTIESSPSGTRVVTRKWQYRDLPEPMRISVISRPMPGERLNGDGYFLHQMPHLVVASVIDGLGHGPDAFVASEAARKILEERYRDPLEILIEALHKGLCNTRGAAISLCRIDLRAGRIEHVGIGNVETRIYGGEEIVRPICFNGTLGMRMENWKVISYPFTRGMTVIMFSDGISGRFELEPSQVARTPQEIANDVFRFARSNDDATVLVGR
jgi:anti-sigma regulatory factor (Ser/Thr protein kinase)